MNVWGFIILIWLAANALALFAGANIAQRRRGGDSRTHRDDSF